jgi:tRNA(His) 5'-end guanylyltransferase
MAKTADQRIKGYIAWRKSKHHREMLGYIAWRKQWLKNHITKKESNKQLKITSPFFLTDSEV